MHRSTMYVDVVYCYGHSSMIYLSVCHDHEPCKNDLYAVWVVDLGGPREPCIRWGFRSPMGGAILKGRPTVKYIYYHPCAAAMRLFCQIILTPCFCGDKLCPHCRMHWIASHFRRRRRTTTLPLQMPYTMENSIGSGLLLIGTSRRFQQVFSVIDGMDVHSAR